jgi:hypothetical protein
LYNFAYPDWRPATRLHASIAEYCSKDGKLYNHGELINSQQPDELDEDPCNICRCMLGEVVCHETQCAPLLPGCRRLDQPHFCCGQVVCGGKLFILMMTSTIDTLSLSTLLPQKSFSVCIDFIIIRQHQSMIILPKRKARIHQRDLNINGNREDVRNGDVIIIWENFSSWICVFLLIWVLL